MMTMICWLETANIAIAFHLFIIVSLQVVSLGFPRVVLDFPQEMYIFPQDLHRLGILEDDNLVSFLSTSL